MPILYQQWISRENLRRNPDRIYVFGDNVARVGMGGQAGAMRGEPNAFGFPTKRQPNMLADSFFNDWSKSDTSNIEEAISVINHYVAVGKTVVVPSDGLGTGLSHLPQRAPRLYAMIYKAFNDLSDGNCPWQKPIS